VIFIANKMDKE